MRFSHRNFSVLLLFSFILTHRQVPITDHFGWKMRKPGNNAAFIQKNSNTWNHHLQLLRPIRVQRTYSHARVYLRKIYIRRSHRVRCKSFSRARAVKAQRYANKRTTELFDIMRDTHVKFSLVHRGTSRRFWSKQKLSRDGGRRTSSAFAPTLISRNFLECERTGRFIVLPDDVRPFFSHRRCLSADLRRDIRATKRPREAAPHRRRGRCGTHTRAGTHVRSGKRKFTSQ